MSISSTTTAPPSLENAVLPHEQLKTEDDKSFGDSGKKKKSSISNFLIHLSGRHRLWGRLFGVFLCIQSINILEFLGPCFSCKPFEKDRGGCAKKKTREIIEQRFGYNQKS